MHHKRGRAKSRRAGRKYWKYNGFDRRTTAERRRDTLDKVEGYGHVRHVRTRHLRG